MGVDEPDLPTLFEWAGGEAAVRRLIDAFYDRVEADDLLAAFFPGGVSELHRAHVAAWWAEVLGGPATYTEELGGYEAMLAHHRDLAITARAAAPVRLDDEPGRRRRRAAGRPRVPGRDHRLRRVGHPAGDAQLPARRRGRRAAPVPRWGWGVAPPWRG